MELETLQGARGFALRAPYPRGRCPLRYRAHPFPLHFSPKDPFIFCKGALRAPYPRGRCPLRYRAHPFPLHFSPKDPFIFCKGRTYRRAEPICLSALSEGTTKTGMKRKSVRAFPPIQFSFHPRQNLLVNFTRFRIASFYISTMSTTL